MSAKNPRPKRLMKSTAPNTVTNMAASSNVTPWDTAMVGTKFLMKRFPDPKIENKNRTRKLHSLGFSGKEINESGYVFMLEEEYRKGH